MNKRVLLGMSGGVDSSVSAVLLKQQGYEVIGCTMRLWECTGSNTAIEDAKKVCEKIGIEHYTLDCREIFTNKVIDTFIGEYKNAKTPNPCVECNKYLKFGVFFEKAKELNCDYIATGHYAKIIYSEKYNQKVLIKSEAEAKDQSYFLYNIKKEQLNHILLPLANYIDKEKIREIARENNLEIAEKKDSQEICFIPDNDYQHFLKKSGKVQLKTGNIVLQNGEILGKHNGLVNYTIGQRKGLGIAYKEPLYVLKLNKEENQVVVGTEKELYSDTLYANKVNWIVDLDNIQEYIECYAKIRYRAKPSRAIIYKEKEDKIKIVFEEEQRAITSGQSIVFYDKEQIVLGGGIIL